MARKLKLELFLSVVIAALLFSVAFSTNMAGLAQGAPNESLADLITQRQILPSGSIIKAYVNQTQATITTERREKDDDETCKLRAILIAKTVFESQPSTVQKAVIVFLDYATNEGDTATIKRAEILEFSERKLDEKDLLASIDFEKRGVTEQKGDVAHGEMQTQREILLERITRMKKQGTNVSAFMSIFNEIEKLAQGDEKAKLKDKIEYLSDKVAEQESVIKAAKSSHATPAASPPFASISQATAGALPEPLTKALAEANLSMAQDPITKMRQVLIFKNDKTTLDTLDAAILKKNREAILKVLMDYSNQHP